jgi:hypothetical protein
VNKLQELIQKASSFKRAVADDYNTRHTEFLHEDHHHHEHSNILAHPKFHSGHKEIHPDGRYSRGTIIAKHPHYGHVRFKPQTDFDASGYSPERPPERDNDHARAWGMAHRELAYHDLMHDHFDLGHHMHHVGLVHHNGKLHSAHEHLGDHITYAHAKGEGWADQKPLKGFHPKKSLNHAYRKGHLHKLAMADYITGNVDRHSNNVMIHKSGAPTKPLQVVDHGLSLPPWRKHLNVWGEYEAETPSYLYHHQHLKSTTQHPKVHEWLKNVNEDHVRDFLKNKGFQHKVHDGVHWRIRNAKAAMGIHKNMRDVMNSLWSNQDHVGE